MRHRVEERDVGARAEREVMGCAHVRPAHEVDPPRVGDDQLRPLAEAPLEAGGEHRMPVRRVGADDEDDVRFRHG